VLPLFADGKESAAAVRAQQPATVMAGLVPAIHVFSAEAS
jgi:hypothetical protein